MTEFVSKDHMINRIMHYLAKFEDGLSSSVLVSKLKLKPDHGIESRLSWLIEKGLIEQVNSSRIYNGLPVKIYRRVK